MQETHVSSIAQVEGEHLLPAVHQIEERCGPEPRPVRTVPALDLDHPRAGGGENRSGERARPQRREVDDEWPNVHRPGRAIEQHPIGPVHTTPLVGPGDRHSQQPAPIDKVGRRTQRNAFAHPAPVLRIDICLEQCRQGGDVVVSRQVENNPPIGGPLEPRRATHRHRSLPFHAGERSTLAEKSGPIEAQNRPESTGRGRHRLCRRHSRVDDTGRCNQRWPIGSSGERHGTTCGPACNIGVRHGRTVATLRRCRLSRPGCGRQTGTFRCSGSERESLGEQRWLI